MTPATRARLQRLVETWRQKGLLLCPDIQCPVDGWRAGEIVERSLGALMFQFADELAACLAVEGEPSTGWMASTQEERDLADLAASPVSYETPVDHYREMARRFSASRDELKHRCRTLEAKLAACLAAEGAPELVGEPETVHHPWLTRIRELTAERDRLAACLAAEGEAHPDHDDDQGTRRGQAEHPPEHLPRPPPER